MDKITNVLLAGIGGQGVMTAAGILAETAIALGHDVKTSPFAGVARRGGPVTCHLRFGTRVLSPQIPTGGADILIAFEPAEGLRWLHMLRPNSGVALINTGRQVPPIVALGHFPYPDDPVGEVRSAGVRVVAVEATELAVALGDIRLANVVLLGAVSGQLPLSADALRTAVQKCFARKGATLQEMNLLAFEGGLASGLATRQASGGKVPPDASWSGGSET